MSSSAKVVGVPLGSTVAGGDPGSERVVQALVDDSRRDSNDRPDERKAQANAASTSSPGPDVALAGSGVRVPVVIALIVVASVIALWPSVESLLGFWRKIHDYRHAPLIVVIAAVWLVLATRASRTERPGGSRVGVAALAGVLACWLIAVNSNILILHQLLLPPAIWLALLAGAGWRIARRVLAPVAYLYFVIPIWEYFVPLLQRLSIFAVEGMLGLAGVPATVREYRVTIPEGTFGIVEGCSGSRYFMVALAVAVLAVFMRHMRGWRSVVFIAASGALALLANWVRIFVVIYAGHVTNMQHYLVAEEHISFGNVLFVVLLVLIFLLASWISRHAAETAHSGRPNDGFQQARVGPMRRWSIVLPLLLLGATFALVQARARSSFEPTALGNLPLTTDEWQGPLPARSDWAPHYVQPLAEARAAYVSRDGGAVDVYVNVYGEQTQGQELVHYSNTLVAPDTWRREWPLRTTDLDSAKGHRLASFGVRSRDGHGWVIAYVYEVGGWQAGSGALAQLLYGARSILKPVPSGVVALAARCEPNCEAAQALVKSFWDDMADELLAIVPDRWNADGAEPR